MMTRSSNGGGQSGTSTAGGRGSSGFAPSWDKHLGEAGDVHQLPDEGPGLNRNHQPRLTGVQVH
jgi:hypothetical protein